MISSNRSFLRKFDFSFSILSRHFPAVLCFLNFMRKIFNSCLELNFISHIVPAFYPLLSKTILQILSILCIIICRIYHFQIFMNYLISITMGYLLGSIPTAYLLLKNSRVRSEEHTSELQSH